MFLAVHNVYAGSSNLLHSAAGNVVYHCCACGESCIYYACRPCCDGDALLLLVDGNCYLLAIVRGDVRSFNLFAGCDGNETTVVYYVAACITGFEASYGLCINSAMAYLFISIIFA